MTARTLHPPVLSTRWTAVWLRNVQVWRKLAIPSLAGNFGDPLLYLFAIGYGLGRYIGEMEGVAYITFFASGLVCASAMNAATFEGLYSAYTRMTTQKTWDGILATPLLVDDIVIGEAVWGATKSLINASIILIVARLLGVIEGWSLLGVPPLIFLTGLCFAAMALTVTAVSPSYDFFLYYFTLVVTPMFLFCGVFFPVRSLPEAMQWVTAVLPLTHAVELMRPPMTGLAMEGSFIVHVAVLVAYPVVFLWVAIALVRKRLLY